MNDEKAEIQSILERAQRLATTVPRWVLRVEQINKEQYEQTAYLARIAFSRAESAGTDTTKFN